MNLWQRWRQKRARHAGQRADRKQEQGLRKQWCLLAGRCDLAALGSPPPLADLVPLYPPSTAFWADPFVWSRDGRCCVFFEDLPFASERGRISCIELDEQARPLGEARPVIEEPYHLSYPFLLEHDGELYMIPEKSAAKRVDLYRCIDFPGRWERARTLVEGIPISDATLFEHEGRWWLFCAMRTKRLRLNETLFAFYADSLWSENWTPHAANPLVRDFSRARPAGRVFRDESGRLLRPAQDCVRRYGHGISLNEVLALSPSRYEERRVWRIGGDQVGEWRALHHMDWHQGVLVMDAQRLIPMPPGAA